MLTASVIAVGGIRLAREVRIERIERDRVALNDFADRLQDELRRLEMRYSERLEGLLASEALVSNIELKEKAEAIWGVRQISLLTRDGRAEFHLAIDDGSLSFPVPEFDEGQAPPGRKVRALDPQVVGVGVPGASGWVARSDSGDDEEMLMFWQTREETRRRVLVVTIDEAEVAARIDEWLVQWLPDSFASVREGAGPDLLSGPSGKLAQVGDIPASVADHAQSVRTRFGDWQLRSWDTRNQVVSYQATVIKVASGLAILVLAVGWFASSKLRQALRLAAQRVSFVNQVSHELRTPLTNILLNVDLATENASSAAKKRLALVRDEAGRLQRLIDNVLSFSTRRQQAAASERRASERCEVARVIDELLSQFSTALKRRGIGVEAEVEPDAWALASADAVAQIVGNLISNVEKYAADAGLLKVKAWSDDGEVVVRVADRGPGIERSQRGRIFEAFQRLDDRVTEGSSGTGLGLSIARDLAEDFGGSLRLVDGDADEDGGVGAVFELRLPRANEPITVIDFPKTQVS